MSESKRIWNELKEEYRQVFVLVKHFLLRYVKNENLEYDDQRIESLVFVLALLVTFGWYISDRSGKLLFMTIMMTITGILCVIVWEQLLLDKKDFLNLVHLPVKGRTIYIAKFFSSLVMIALISISISLFSAIPYTYIYAGERGVSAFYYFLTFLLANFLANWFVFLLVAAVQSLLKIFLKGKLFARFSLLAQVILLIGLASVFIWFPRFYEANPQVQEHFSSYHYYLPPLWFNGFHEWLTGGGDFLKFHVGVAILALVLPMLMYAFSLPLSLHRCLTQNGINSSKRKNKLFKLLTRGREFFRSIVLKDPVQCAVYYFYLQIVKRSRQQKIQLAMYMALPVGFVLTYLVYLFKDIGAVDFRQYNLGQMAIPFVLYFAMITGLRLVVEHPVDLDANWVFRLTAGNSSKQYTRGLKKAMFFHFLLPLTFLLFLFYLYCWGFAAASRFTIYSTVVSLLLVEVFFFNYRKVPFAAEYNPGIINLKLTWPLFLLLFLLYYFVYVNLGVWLLLQPTAKFVFYPLVLMIFLGFRWYGEQSCHQGLVFEEKEMPAMLSLDIG